MTAAATALVVLAGVPGGIAQAGPLGVNTRDVPGVGGGPNVPPPNLPGPADRILDDVVRDVNGLTDSVVPPAPAPPVPQPPGAGAEPGAGQGGADGARPGEQPQLRGDGSGEAGDRAGGGDRDRPAPGDVSNASVAIGTAETGSNSLPGQFVDALEALPLSLLIAVIAIAALGIAMAVRSAWLAALAKRLRRHEQELEADVGALQSALLPAVPARIGEVELSVACRPADGPAAGGDFYDVLELDERRVALLIGDVSGHGREALTATALVHYTLRAYLEAGTRPRQALRLTDQALTGRLGEHYATVVAAVYDVATSTLDYATAGHPSPLLGGAGEDRAIEALAPPIGVGCPSGARETRISIRPGTRICLFTDGLIEASTGGGARFERRGLGELLERLDGRCDAEELLDRLGRQATPSDDATVLLLHPEAAAGDGTVVEEIELEPRAATVLPGVLESFGMTTEQADAVMAEVLRRLDGRVRTLLRLTRRGPQVDWELTDNRRLREISTPPAQSNGTSQQPLVAAG
jgi:serine phosphatase RsbU (regulator of sigma subunit)